MTERGARTDGPMTIAVAGGTGFVGGAIAAELAARGNSVLVLSHRRGLPAALTRPELGGLVEIRHADVTRPETLPAALSGADAVVVALAFRNYPVEAPRRGQTFDRIDAGGAIAVAGAARSAGVGRFLYMSGAGASPNASKTWYRAKWRAEEFIRASGLTYTIFRPSWIYGPGDKSLNRFLAFGRWLPFIPQFGPGRQQLAPVFVDDMAALVADALDTPTTDNSVIEVGGPDVLTMNEIVKRALKISGRRRPLLHAPVIFAKAATAPLVLLPSPPMRPSAIDFAIQGAPVDTTRLHELLPRRLTRLDEALATYLQPRKA
jgi:uncharacterized protein YbjT (DUF2867 family)